MAVGTNLLGITITRLVEATDPEACVWCCCGWGGAAGGPAVESIAAPERKAHEEEAAFSCDELEL